MTTALTAHTAPQTSWAGLTTDKNSEHLKSLRDVLAFAAIGLALSSAILAKIPDSLVFLNF